MAIVTGTLPEIGHGSTESVRDHPNPATGRPSPCPQHHHQNPKSGRNCVDQMILWWSCPVAVRLRLPAKWRKRPASGGQASCAFCRRRNLKRTKNFFEVVQNRSHAELIAEAQQALTAAKRLVDEQTAIVQRLERTGGCNSEAIYLLNNLRELLAARQCRLARVLSWPSWDNAA